MLQVGLHTTCQAGDVRITQHPGVILQPLLQWNSYKHFTRTAKAEASNQAIITYSEYEFVALGIQREMLIHHIVICDLSGSTIFFSNYLINGTFSEKSY
jgi:hypothetical protein